MRFFISLLFLTSLCLVQTTFAQDNFSTEVFSNFNEPTDENLINPPEFDFQTNGVSIYPIPTTGLAHCTFSLNLPTNVQFTVYNRWGMEIHSQNINTMPAGTSTLNFNLENQPAGTYFARLILGTDFVSNFMIYKI